MDPFVDSFIKKKQQERDNGYSYSPTGGSDYDNKDPFVSSFIARKAEQKSYTASQPRVDENGQPVMSEAEKAQRRKFATYEVGEKKAKKAFGIDVSGVLGDKYGYTRSVGISDKVADLDKDDFLKRFDGMNDEYQKVYVNGLKKKVQKVENDAAKKFDELTKSGKSEEQAKAEIAKTIGEDYYAATNTLQTLDEEGRFKGGLMDFIEGSNDRLFGGIARSAIRTGYWLSGNSDKSEKVINNIGIDNDGGEFTDAGKTGEKFGSVQKGIVDVGTMFTGAGAVDKLAKGTKVVQALDKGGKAAKAAGFVAKTVPGSIVATGIDAQQELGRGNEVDLKKSLAIGTGADLILPGAGKLLKTGDSAAGRQVAKLFGDNSETGSRILQNIGDNGIIGGVNKRLSDAGRSVTYKVSDMMGSTKAGSKIIDLKDDFMTKWVGEMHPLYKTLKRSDFEGTTTGAYAAAREAIGNSNRALSYAQDFVDNNESMLKLTDGLEGRGKDLVKVRKEFDEFAKVRSELDLAASGKKQFGEKKMAELQERAAKFADGGFDEEYKQLTQFYKDLNDFRLQEGLISKADYDRFAEEGFDYVRQQRELPEWMLDKPGGRAGGSRASITKSGAIQKRSKYASAELLSPLETAIKTAQSAHVEAYRNRAAKSIYGLLESAGEAKLVRSTDLVREKRALLTALKDSKPLVTKLNKTIKTSKNQASALTKEMNALRRQGRNELSKELNKFVKEYNKTLGRKPDAVLNVKQTMEMLATMDNKELRKIRKMLETRSNKLEPLLDKIELLNRDLADLHGERSGIWNQAMATKTSVDKSGMTSLSFLDDGIENVVKIDPSIASAIHGWDKQSQNVMSETLRMANQIFKYGTTGANAGFALPNFVADQVGSAINSRSLMSTHSPRNFVHSLFMTMGKPLNAEDAAILQAFTRGNKGQTLINQYTKKATGDKAANAIVKRNAKLGTKIYTNLKNPREGFRALFDATEGIVASTENLTRIQNFRGAAKKAIKEGMGDDALRIANQQARENSIDFLEMGSYGRVVNNFIPYFNASIQGSRTILRNAAERPVSFAAKTAALIGAPIAASTAWNVSDPERKAIYDTIPEYVKETNFIIIGPNAKWNEEKRKYDNVFLMKKPPGHKEFAEPVRKFIEYKVDQGDASILEFIKDQPGELTSDFAGGFSPIDFSDKDKFLSSVTPQILKPTAEAILNRNFFTGGDIVSDKLSELPANEQHYDQYSQLTAHIAGLFNTSPLKVDHWIKQTFGEVGTNAVNLADRTSQAIGTNPDGNVGGRSLPESISRRFYGAPSGADRDAFFSSYEPASKAKAKVSKEVTSLVKQGKINEARRKAEEFNATLAERFSEFQQKYSDSPTYDSYWDELMQGLEISTTKNAFKARARN